MLLLSLQLWGIIHTTPFNTPTSAQQTGFSLHYFADVLCFQHDAAVRKKNRKKNICTFISTTL